MTEDSLARHHIPDKTAIIRGEAESGIKKEWEDIFHQEEANTPSGARVPGGGEGAIEKFFTHPDSVSPELPLLFSDFLSDIYGIKDKDELSAAAGDELATLKAKYRELPSPELQDKIDILEFMLGAGFERQMERNFVEWMNAPENKKGKYNLQYVPESILANLRDRELRKEIVKLTVDLQKIDLKNPRQVENAKIDMQAWLNAWTDPEAQLEAAGILFENGRVKSIALKSKKYGVTPVPFIPWSRVLGGKKYIEKRNGTVTAGFNFGKAHIIAPGIGQDAIKQTLRTLEINKISRPNLRVAFFWTK